MNGIILQWLRSEPMCEAAKQQGNGWRLCLPKSALIGLVLVAVILLGLCLILLLLALAKWRRRRRTVLSRSGEAGDSITQELPVEAVRAAAADLRILTEIVYCESEEVIWLSSESG